jgi:hypothetical protein
MSYAGPATRASRAPETEPLGSSETPRRSAVSALVPVREKPGFGSNRETMTVFAAGLALGVALGAGAALLLAPQSGSETRHEIVRRSRRIGRRSRDAWDDLRDELRRAARRGSRALRRRRERSAAE